MSEEKKEKEVVLCGHVNRHSPEPHLVCTLEKGHIGNHRATKLVKASQLSGLLEEDMLSLYEYKEDENGVGWYVGDIPSEWSDIAGTPVSEIVPASPGIEIIDYEQQKEWERDQEIAGLQDQIAELTTLVSGGAPVADAKEKEEQEKLIAGLQSQIQELEKRPDEAAELNITIALLEEKLVKQAEDHGKTVEGLVERLEQLEKNAPTSVLNE
jgi:hypothetical protein